MNMKQYLQKHRKDRQKLRDLAKTVGVQRIYLTQIAGGHCRPSAALAQRIHTATGGEVHMSELRPDVYPPDIFNAVAAQ